MIGQVRTGLVIALAMLAMVGCSQPAPKRAEQAANADSKVLAASLPDAQRQKIEAVVREYLLTNPQLMEEVYAALEQKRNSVSAEEEADLAVKRMELRPQIENDTRDFSVGPADAKVVVVEFFDYNCPYCRSGFEFVQQLMRENKNIRFVFKELPILGPASVEAAQAALAAKAQGKYLEFHAALMTQEGRVDSASIERTAVKLGLNMARFKKEAAATEAHAAHFADNEQEALALGVRGTPAFMINGVLIPGFDPQAIQAAISAAGE